eukprot:TRINITY_DN58256_c0_g1_i1.p2 TRINITY_DN58256_c0_g1~~TRINITY_DN58256_c0_g1_i1.p2  ORF type:complete len:153 (-),score=25.34 TRINITY_DN58256_c0_g1_i1:61-519(-)
MRSFFSVALPSLLASRALSAHCTYPGGDCFELKMQRCEGSDRYTMHGLWAEWQNGCDGPAYDPDAISSIRSEMEDVWPTCYGGKTNDEFWGHEWEKHGTCSGMGELEYFQKALDLYQQHEGQCGGSSECAICFSRDFTEQESCPNAADALIV